MNTTPDEINSRVSDTVGMVSKAGYSVSEDVAFQRELASFRVHRAFHSRNLFSQEVIILISTSGQLWVRCPNCNNKTRIKVYSDTVLLNFPLYCPKCKRETKVDIAKLKMVVRKEPDA